MALAWREDCAAHEENVALCYFAGHGVQRTRTDAVLLLEDFLSTGGDPLSSGVDVNNLVNGMAPTTTRPRMARTQLWFLDTCRAFPSAFDRFEVLQPSTVFEVGLSDRDDRSAPIYFGSLPGATAYAQPGGFTIFSRALLECLDGAAGVRRAGTPLWDVTIGSLAQALDPVVQMVNAVTGGDQEIFVAGQLARPKGRIVTAPGVPDVQVSLELRPGPAAEAVVLQVIAADGSPKAVPAPLVPNPFSDRWSAGVYRMGVAPPGCGLADDDLVVLPPEFEWVGEVTL
jgi:hypothetical protein